MTEPNKFELPSELPTNREDLEALELTATEAFQSRYDAGATTQDDLVELQEIAESIREIRAAIAAVDEASDEDEEPETDEEDETSEETDADSDSEPETPEAPVVEEDAPSEEASAAGAVLDALLLQSPPAGAPSTPEVVSTETVASEPAPVAQPTPAPVSAPAPAAIAASVSHPEDTQLPVTTPAPITIVASADIPGVPSASTLDGWDGLVAAVGAKARSLPDLPGSRYPVASIHKPLSSERFLDGLSEREQIERMQDLSSPSSLLASGGWCAPSETIYDFACEVESPPQMVDLPTFSTSRGGVRYPISPTFRDFKALENNGLFTWTEEDDIAAGEEGGPTKPCFKIPCVEFDECRLELEGLCVTAGNLTDLAYPELTRRYLSLVLTAHLHRLNTRKIAKMIELVDDSVTLGATFGAASALLAGLELQVEDLRCQFSMSPNALIEGMAPMWVRSVIRADIARREGQDLDTVSNQQIQNYLQTAGIRLQFVSNWQEICNEDNSPITVWPDEVQILLWLPGAYRELTGPSLDIAVARDSTQNATNDHTVAFTEESFQICKPGCGARLVTIPICPSGAVGASVELECPVA